MDSFWLRNEGRIFLNLVECQMKSQCLNEKKFSTHLLAATTGTGQSKNGLNCFSIWTFGI